MQLNCRSSISSITYDTAIKVFEKRKRKNANWVEAFWLEMEPEITARRTALLKYKQCPSKQKLEDLRNARNTTQQTARCCANKYWKQLCTEIPACFRYWKHQRHVWGNKESNWFNTIQNSSPQVQNWSRLLPTQINRWRDGWNTI